MTSPAGPPGREHPFFRNLAERRQRRAQQPAPVAAAGDAPPKPRYPRTFRRTAAHYWHHQRRAAREAGNRYPSFVQVPGPWRVAKLGAAARARQGDRPLGSVRRVAWLEWLATRPKVLLTRSGIARLAVEAFSVVVVLGTLWGFWNEREDRRADRINAAWTLIAAAKQEQTGNLGLVDAIATLRGYGISDFTGLFLPGAYLQGTDLARAVLDSATLRESDLRHADLSGANLFGSDLSGANLAGVDLSGAWAWGADISGAFGGHTNFSGADLWFAQLSGAHLRFADFSGANLLEADFSGSDLADADLSGTDLGAADLSFARMVDVHGLEFAEFCGADRRSLSLEVPCADLAGADLRGTPFGIDAPGPDVMPAPDSRR